jgi:hypothetical protein
MPATNPATTAITPKPNQPPVGTPAPMPARNPGASPASHDQQGSGAARRGAIHAQNPNAINAPVREDAMNPARDLRRARGRWRSGTRGGRGGVYGPRRRPKVEAAVSAQERLQVG